MQDLVQAYEEEKDARIKERILAVKLHLVDGKSEKEVSKMLNKGYSTIKLWVGKYKKEGLNGLRDKPRSGRPRKAEEGKIKQILEDQPQKYGIQEEYWTMRTFKIALQQQGIEYKKSRLYELVHELGYNLVKPRPTNVQAKKDMWDDFKIGRRGSLLSRRE
ncbi:ORF1 in transposon ISC1048 [Sulfolobus islandicus M.16.4]|uniref:ORF1 in transposon ISC1048 n=1 Tax=Saccharolobus islandicus (strain M.16.4 / Kamchatka \|nr:ORF1 in transposon ISC1048 [Sulfolobus islandicus M.16.4]